MLAAEESKELMKKVSFLSKEIDEGKEALQGLKGSLEQREEELEEAGKKNQEVKLFYEYELETFKKKLLDLEMEAEELSRQLSHELRDKEVLIRENHIKTASIDNLEKIVNELIRKNQVAELNAGPIEQEIRKNEELEFRRQLVYLEK